MFCCAHYSCRRILNSSKRLSFRSLLSPLTQRQCETWDTFWLCIGSSYIQMIFSSRSMYIYPSSVYSALTLLQSLRWYLSLGISRYPIIRPMSGYQKWYFDAVISQTVNEKTLCNFLIINIHTYIYRQAWWILSPLLSLSPRVKMLSLFTSNCFEFFSCACRGCYCGTKSSPENLFYKEN